MKMSKWSILSIAAASVVAITMNAQAGEVKIALDSPANMEKAGSYVWAHTFAEELKKGGMTVKEFPRGALGGEAERLDQVSQGLLEINMADVKSAGKIDKLIFGLYLPYLFKDNDHQDRAVAHAGLEQMINAKIAKGGVRILARTLIGPASGIFNTKRAVMSIKDMSDLQMRALDENQIALYEAWGSNGTIVAWKEVPNALQTGVAHGYMNPSFVPVMFGHTDFIKHFTDAKAIVGGRLALASEDWYQGLSAKERGIVDAAAATATATKANRAWLKKAEPGMLKGLEKAGVKIVQLTPEARAEFEALSKTVYTNGVLSAEQVKIWVDAANATR
jgi:TRAP-type C4-dicarboxylate transport system substrate-binding protein